MASYLYVQKKIELNRAPAANGNTPDWSAAGAGGPRSLGSYPGSSVCLHTVTEVEEGNAETGPSLVPAGIMPSERHDPHLGQPGRSAVGSFGYFLPFC